MEFSIKKPTEKHLEQMVKLADESRYYHIEILNGYFKKDLSDEELVSIKNHMTWADRMIFVAVDTNDNVLGMIMGGIGNKFWLVDSDVGYVSNFIVSKTSRNQGIGTKLMDTFIQECKNRGAKEITLGVYNKNKDSYDFYTKYGFSPIVQKMSKKI